MTMEDDQEQRPESLLPYDEWTEEALRHVVLQALKYVAANGLPGEHHLYITFRTDHPGTVIPPRLRAQYPQEMTIVLQHQFWDLRVDEEAGLFSIGLSFGGVPATLAVPLAAVVGFADPHIRYGLRFRAASPEPAQEEAPAAEPEPASEAASSDSAPQVVSLDAFRRRPPSKEES
jgi:hypothetical protein